MQPDTGQHSARGMAWRARRGGVDPVSAMRTVPFQIALRIGLLFAALLGLFLAAIGGIHFIERNGVRKIVADEELVRGQALDAFLMHAGRPLRLFVESYARRITFTRPAEVSRGASPEGTLRTGLRTFEIDAAWIIETDGQVRLHESTRASADLAASPVTPVQLAALNGSPVKYYMERGGELYQVVGHRLAADMTRQGVPRGWIFAARRWEIADFLSPRFPLEGVVSILRPGAKAPAAPHEPAIHLERIFRDLEGRPVRIFHVHHRTLVLDVLEQNDWLEIAVMATFGVAACGLLIFCLVRWVILPAAIMRRILAARDPAATLPLLQRGGYVAPLAQLVRELLETQARLEQTLRERALLGRELHDGAIQAIYAAGVGIVAARAALRENPAEAEQILDDSRTELNATIVELRTFIGGLDPDHASDRTMTEAVRTMTTLLAAAHPIKFILHIDEAVAQAFSPRQRMHLLQIVREAVSNAVRHSGAHTVTLSLRRDDDTVTLHIADDGRWAEASPGGGDGRGLANFQARAQELAGTVARSDTPEGGTQITVTLPYPSASAHALPL